MKKTLTVILVAGVMLSCVGSLWAQSDFDYSKVTRLRWMDPYREPITYQEYRESREFAQHLGARLVYAGSKGEVPVCIVINNYLHFTIQSSFSVFISDLESDG
ncbi:MAG: hypothetical protein WBC98_07510, partial [Candidatus Zixiibacteriota bacterium]